MLLYLVLHFAAIQDQALNLALLLQLFLSQTLSRCAVCSKHYTAQCDNVWYSEE